MSNLFTRYLNVCKLWTIDKSKLGRDFGEHLRKQIPFIFPLGEHSKVDPEWEDKISALERLCSNSYNNIKIEGIYSTSSGSDYQIIREFTSTKAQEYFKSQDVSFVQQIKHLLSHSMDSNKNEEAKKINVQNL